MSTDSAQQIHTMSVASDFTSLDVPYELEGKGLNTHETEIHGLSVSKPPVPADRAPAKFENEVSSGGYIPVNVIPNEVLALIETWESSFLSIHPDRNDLESSPACFGDLEPPKRFSRTLQRSTSRQMPALSSLQSRNDDN
jgi:hypothetical protein